MQTQLGKLFKLLLIMSVLFACFPMQFATANSETISTLGDVPADSWPAFTEYTRDDGSELFDPADEPGISPDDVDFTSGADKGAGNLPSFYVASDSVNMFFRVRLKGNPYDRKGGFLSTVWLVQLGLNGQTKATIGVNGKPTKDDYVYIANADGTEVSYIYKTRENSSPTMVDGTRIIAAENGQYFLDFQIPIARITEVAPEITSGTSLQLNFATSKAANLAVINKDGDDNNPFTGKKMITPSNVNPVSTGAQLTIDGGESQVVHSITPTITGKAHASGNSNFVDIVVDNGTPTSKKKVNSDGTWSIVLNDSSLTANSGPYTLTARLYQGSSSDTADVTDTQQLYIVMDDTSTFVTISSIGDHALPAIRGTAEAGDQVSVLVDGAIKGTVMADTDGTWEYTLEKPLSQGTHEFSVSASDQAGNTASAGPQNYSVPSSEVSISIDNGSSVTTIDNQPTFRGRTNAPDGSTFQVDIVDHNDAVETFTSEVTLLDGIWTLPYPLNQTLEDGAYTVTASVYSAEDSSISASTVQNLIVDTTTDVTITDPVNHAQTTDVTPTLEGKAEAGGTVTLYIDNGMLVSTVTADQHGDWTYTPTSPLAEALHTISVKASDFNGNEAEAESDFTVTSTLTPPSLAVSRAVVHEASLNDGSITETEVVTLSNGTFSTGLSKANVMLNQLPQGLDYEVNRDSDTQFTITFTGNAAAHTQSDNVSDVTVTVSTPGIDGVSTDVTSGVFGIEYLDPAAVTPPSLAVSRAVVHEASSNDGSITEPEVVTLSNGTFSTGLSKANVTLNQLPQGLDYEVTRDSDTQFTITFTGNAAAHTQSDNVSDVTVTVSTPGIDGVSTDVTSGEFGIEYLDPAELTILSFVPVDDASDVEVNASLAITFDKPVSAVADKKIAIKKTSDDSVVEEFNADAASVSIDGAVVTIQPTNTFAYSTAYYVEVAEGAFQAEDNAQSEEISGTTLWNFTTVQAATTASHKKSKSSGTSGTSPVKIHIASGSAEGSNTDTETQSVTKLLGGNFNMEAELVGMDGTPIDVPEMEITADGQLNLPSVPAGQYKMLMHVVAPTGEILAGSEARLTVSSDGEASVEGDLIDPFGTVTDVMLNEPIEGVTLNIYWADTDLNRSKNRKPNTRVELPELPDFEPNQNHNPQVTDNKGQYGWMVFPDGDYYLIAEKDGFVTFDSRQDQRDEKQGDTSYIRNGIIHVGDTIVHYSFSLQPEVAESGEHTPYMLGYPDGMFKPEGNITRGEFAAIIYRILGLKDNEQQEEAIYNDISDYWGAHEILEVSRQGMMQGYSDGTFRPQSFITRAEIATVIDHIKERIPRKEHTSKQTATITDISGHWAQDAIQRVVQEDLFGGYSDGTFQPDRYISRAEAVTAVNQLLDRQPWVVDDEQSWPDAPKTHWAYKDIMEASNDHGYDLYTNGLGNWKK